MVEQGSTRTEVYYLDRPAVSILVNVAIQCKQ